MKEKPWGRPAWSPIWLACKACRHEWDDWQPTMVPVETWVAHCRTYHCPSCGKGGRDILVRLHALSTEAMVLNRDEAPG